jgi:dihydrofolate reductase
MDRNTRGIGYNGSMPWRQQVDMARFAYLTHNHAVVMGNNTYTSIGKPLSDRYNIILSNKSKTYSPNIYEGKAKFSPSLTDALVTAKSFTEDMGLDTIFIIGGQSLYEQTLPMTDIIYATILDTDLTNFDTFYPEFLPYFDKVDKVDVRGINNEKNTYPYVFNTFLRK